ncbi:MAG: CocE/NonD family hydrolase [Bacteroidales bacterium]
MKLKMVILLCTLCINSYAVTERITIIGSLGKLSATIQRPTPKVEDKCPMVMLLHGFMGSQNGTIEESMANALEDAGIATIRFDFNGHGSSEGEFENMTLPNEIEDAKCVY